MTEEFDGFGGQGIVGQIAQVFHLDGDLEGAVGPRAGNLFVGVVGGDLHRAGRGVGAHVPGIEQDAGGRGTGFHRPKFESCSARLDGEVGKPFPGGVHIYVIHRAIRLRHLHLTDEIGVGIRSRGGGNGQKGGEETVPDEGGIHGFSGVAGEVAVGFASGFSGRTEMGPPL